MTGPVAGMFKAWKWAESSLARLTSVLFRTPASACSQAFTPLRNPSSACDVIRDRGEERNLPSADLRPFPRCLLSLDLGLGTCLTLALLQQVLARPSTIDRITEKRAFYSHPSNTLSNGRSLARPVPRSSRRPPPPSLCNLTSICNCLRRRFLRSDLKGALGRRLHLFTIPASLAVCFRHP
jgi:hypothetical protein